MKEKDLEAGIVLQGQKNFIKSIKPETAADIFDDGGAKGKTAGHDYEVKLLRQPEIFVDRQMPELPEKLLHANKKGSMLAIKKHISDQTGVELDAIEVLCKNLPVKDSHTLEHVYDNFWFEPKNDQEEEFSALGKSMVLSYRRKHKNQ